MTVSTCDVLRSIGFVEDHNPYSDPPGGLSIDFGNFQLSAIYCLNRLFVPVVMLSGVMVTPRTIAEVEGEMPREVESWEQGVAFVTDCLDRHSSDHVFEPAIPMPWFVAGRKNRHLLPWEGERAAYAARPCCHVPRDWARVALRDLSTQLEALEDDAPVTFEFDGEVLRIRCGDSLIAMSAQGKSWPARYSLRAGGLRQLPRRLMHERVYFEVWDSALRIDRYRYKGMVSMDARESACEP